MPMRWTKALAWAALGAAAAPACAWNATGHMVSALLAWRKLTAAQQQQAAGILKAACAGPDALPRFASDLKAGMPEGLSPDLQDAYMFCRAAVWPDVVRDRQHPANPQHHKGPWHYYDVPYVPPGDSIAKPADPPVSPDGEEPGDLISALRLTQRDLKAPGTPAATRAARLCFMLHLGGDLHQPLHCTQMFSADGLPNGDQGGNLQLVRRANGAAPMTLHAVWDDLLGPDASFPVVEEIALRLERDPQGSAEAFAADLAKTATIDWMRDGAALAAEHVYRQGTLATLRGVNARTFQNERRDPALVPILPAEYERDNRPLAERRIALAGHRMARLVGDALP